MEWIKTYTHRFYLSFAVLFASFFMSFFCLSSDSFALSWTSDNLASYVNSLSDNSSTFSVTLSSINYPSDLYDTARYISVFYKGTYSGTFSSFYPEISFAGFDKLVLPYGVRSLYGVSDGFTFSSCFPRGISTTQSGNISLNFYHFGRLRNNTTDLYLTFSDECPSGGSAPSGSLSITENGTYDVTNYAEAVVDVPVSGGSGDSDCTYTDILEEIKSAIIFVPAVLLVIYFFYAIYKMILGGVRR